MTLKKESLWERLKPKIRERENMSKEDLEDLIAQKAKRQDEIAQKIREGNLDATELVSLQAERSQLMAEITNLMAQYENMKDVVEESPALDSSVSSHIEDDIVDNGTDEADEANETDEIIDDVVDISEADEPWSSAEEIDDEDFIDLEEIVDHDLLEEDLTVPQEAPDLASLIGEEIIDSAWNIQEEMDVYGERVVEEGFSIAAGPRGKTVIREYLTPQGAVIHKLVVTDYLSHGMNDLLVETIKLSKDEGGLFIPETYILNLHQGNTRYTALLDSEEEDLKIYVRGREVASVSPTIKNNALFFERDGESVYQGDEALSNKVISPTIFKKHDLM